MPRFAVELEYLVPVWTTVVVEVDDENHVKAAPDDADCWDHAETDYDGALVPSWSGAASCRKQWRAPSPQWHPAAHSPTRRSTISSTPSGIASNHELLPASEKSGQSRRF